MIWYLVEMALGTLWAGYYSAHLHTAFIKNPHTRTYTSVGTMFGVRPHTLWASKHSYSRPIHELQQQKDNK